MHRFSWLHKPKTGRPHLRPTPAGRPTLRLRPQQEVLERNDVLRFGSLVASAGALPLALLDRARARDPEAWQRLVELYRPLVLFWCRCGGIPPGDVEDVTQETFVAVCQGLPRFHHDRPGDTFGGWLRVITRNHIRLYFRKTHGQIRAEGGEMAQRRLDGIIDHLSEPVEGVPSPIKERYRRAIEQVRSEFEERTWQAFWLTAVDSRMPADLIEELDMTTAAIRQAKSRVLRRLREVVGELLR